MFEKEKRKSKAPWHSTVRGCALALVATVIAVGCGFLSLFWGDDNVVCFRTPFPAYEDVERAGFFEFPSSAQAVEYRAEATSEHCDVWLKFELNPEDFNSFKASTLIEDFKPQQLEGIAIQHMLRRQGWGQPAGSPAGEGYTRNEDARSVYQYIFVDNSNPDKFTAYIIIAQMWI